MRRRDAITTGVMGATALLAGCRPEPTTTLASGREIDPMITHILPLSDINKGFDLMHKGESIRSVVVY